MQTGLAQKRRGPPIVNAPSAKALRRKQMVQLSAEAELIFSSFQEACSARGIRGVQRSGGFKIQAEIDVRGSSDSYLLAQVTSSERPSDNCSGEEVARRGFDFLQFMASSPRLIELLEANSQSETTLAAPYGPMACVGEQIPKQISITLNKLPSEAHLAALRQHKMALRAEVAKALLPFEMSLKTCHGLKLKLKHRWRLSGDSRASLGIRVVHKSAPDNSQWDSSCLSRFQRAEAELQLLRDFIACDFPEKIYKGILQLKTSEQFREPGRRVVQWPGEQSQTVEVTKCLLRVSAPSALVKATMDDLPVVPERRRARMFSLYVYEYGEDFSAIVGRTPMDRVEMATTENGWPWLEIGTVVESKSQVYSLGSNGRWGGVTSAGSGEGDPKLIVAPFEGDAPSDDENDSDQEPDERSIFVMHKDYCDFHRRNAAECDRGDSCEKFHYPEGSLCLRWYDDRVENGVHLVLYPPKDSDIHPEEEEQDSDTEEKWDDSECVAKQARLDSALRRITELETKLDETRHLLETQEKLAATMGKQKNNAEERGKLLLEGIKVKKEKLTEVAEAAKDAEPGCPLCMESVCGEESLRTPVCLYPCNHVVCESCWGQHAARQASEEPPCPCCKGSVRSAKRLFISLLRDIS